MKKQSKGIFNYIFFYNKQNLDYNKLRLVYELDCDENASDGVIRWNSSYLWKYKLNADINHLSEKLKRIDSDAGGISSLSFCIV